MFVSNIFLLTVTISFSLSVWFCIPGHRNLFLVLISSCMGLAQDSISMWYHIVVYRFSHRPWTAHKCQRQGFRHTMHHEASLHHKVRNGRGWHAECIYLCACIWMWALMQQREQRECMMHLSPAAHPIFSVRWSAPCRQLNMDSSRIYIC